MGEDAKPLFPFPVGVLTISGKGVTIRTILELLHKYKPTSVKTSGSVNKGPKIPKSIKPYVRPVDISYDGCYSFPLDSISNSIPNITKLSNVPQYSYNCDTIIPFFLNDLMHFKNLQHLSLVQTNVRIEDDLEALFNVTDSIYFKHREVKCNDPGLGFGRNSNNISRLFRLSKAKTVSQDLDIVTNGKLCDFNPMIDPIEGSSPDREFKLGFIKTYRSSIHDTDNNRLAININSTIMKLETSNSVGYKMPNLRISEFGRVILAYHSDIPISIKELVIMPIVPDSGAGPYFGVFFSCLNQYVTIDHLDFIGTRFQVHSARRFWVGINVDTAMEYEDDFKMSYFGTNVSGHSLFGSSEEEKNIVFFNGVLAKINVVDIPFTERNIIENREVLNSVKVLNIHPIKEIIVSGKEFFDKYVKPELRDIIMGLDCEVNIVDLGTTTLIKEGVIPERPLKKQKTM